MAKQTRGTAPSHAERSRASERDIAAPTEETMDALPAAYAIRSKTGRPFRRSGVSFSPDKWTVLTDPTEEQLAETHLEVLRVCEENADRLLSFPAEDGALLAWPLGQEEVAGAPIAQEESGEEAGEGGNSGEARTGEGETGRGETSGDD